MGLSADQSPGAQLELFAGLAVPEPLPRRRRTRKRRPAVAVIPIQFAIDLRERVEIDPDEIEEAGDRFTHVVVSAAECPLPKTRAACSIFSLASEFAARQVIAEFMLGQDDDELDSTPPPDPHHRRIIRDGDTTRHISMRYQDTEEWAEKERARRARQKLPKPPKQTFKLRSKAAA